VLAERQKTAFLTVCYALIYGLQCGTRRNERGITTPASSAPR